MVQISGLTFAQAEEILSARTPGHILEFYNKPYNLTENDISRYKENGFISLKNILDTPTLGYVRKVIGAAVLLRKDSDKRSLAEKSQYEQSFLQCGYLAWDFPAVKDFVFGKRFAGIARDLMNVTSVRLWHDQALYKEPGGRHTDIHQDSGYWPVSNPAFTTTMWLALNDVPREKGCLYFYPGTHKSGKVEYVDIFKNPHRPEGLAENEKIYTPLNAGDCTFHSGLTYHGALENQTTEMREGMTIIYLDEKSAFDTHDTRNATHKSCSGLKNGEKINTKFTPVLI